MELELSRDQKSYLQTLRRFLEAEAPIGAIREPADGPEPGAGTYWKQAADLGWTSMLVDDELGGGCLSGRPLADLVLVAEELGRVVAPGPLVPCNVVAATLARSGSAHQRETVLPALLSGDAIAAWAVAGPGGRWEAGAVRAEERAAGVLLTGTAHYVEAAGMASYLLVTASTSTGPRQLLVPAQHSGVRIVPVPGLDLSRRFARVEFDDVLVADTAFVGTAGSTSADVERQLQLAIALQCAATMGGLDTVFARTLDYAQARVAFGRPIGSYQAIKHRLADAKLWLEAGHGITAELVTAIEQGSADAVELASVAKAHIGEHALSIIQECVQVHGGIGVTWEHDLHLYLRRATVDRTLYGDPGTHRERLCALAGI